MLFRSQTEVRNCDYKEYLSWLSRIYGNKSDVYKSAFPDTTVWAGVNIIYIEKYFGNPQYANYPVVGVSIEQAKKYCKWRSDRVYEWVLVLNKVIDKSNSKDTIFTIESYLNGKYPTKRNLKKDENYPIPEYGLPTKEEWEFAASSNLNNQSFEFGTKDMTKIRYNTKEILADYTVEVKKSEKNDFNLYGMIGNISEMIDDSGISKGGSWFHSKDECKIKNDIQYSKPMSWLGFRCICKLKYKN